MISKWDKYGPVPEGTGDLFPLGPELRTGLKFIGILAVFSLILCSSLFLFITYRLVEGRLRGRGQDEHQSIDGNIADCLDGNGNGNTFLLQASISPKFPPTPTSSISKTPLSPYTRAGTTLTEFYHGLGDDDRRRARPAVPNIRQSYQGYHPLLVLIYMLLIADIIQSASFIPNLVWVTQDAITVRTGTCWAQGWLRSQGDSKWLYLVLFNIFFFF